MRHIAVIGSGIAGLAAAYLLSRRYEVTLFERDSRLGGHTHTVDVETAAGAVRLDTGFLVHNERTYPHLVRLFAEIGIVATDSDMSFAVSCRRSGLEYSSRGPGGYFAQRRNLWSRRHWRLLREIVRFNREAAALLDAPAAHPQTLGDFLEERRFGSELVERYLLPMASAIWSASMQAIRRFPALTLMRFLANHGLLSVHGQPTWKVVAGGSDTYIPLLIEPLAGRVYRSAGIDAVSRGADSVTLRFTHRPPMTFDAVVMACHGDQVLPLLADPTPAEREVFGRFHTTANHVCLHTDASVLPDNPRAGASWNYLLDGPEDAPPAVTYDLNRLQGLTTTTRFCVTLNPRTALDERRVLRRFVYRHPLMTAESLRAQARWPEVSGAARIHYCGAYWGHGFHEDGLASAIRVGAALGVTW